VNVNFTGFVKFFEHLAIALEVQKYWADRIPIILAITFVGTPGSQPAMSEATPKYPEELP
jgi:hypothetical protein